MGLRGRRDRWKDQVRKRDGERRRLIRIAREIVRTVRENAGE